jgi:hypothetical protein
MSTRSLSSRAGVIALIAASTLGAQSRNLAVVRVTARDSSGAPITSAELTVVRGIRDVVARGRTDDAGQGVLTFEVKDSSDFQVTMRKIGYARGDRFFEAGPFDTTRVAIIVAVPKPNQLATVAVTAQADPKYKSYHLDADDIEKASGDMFLDNGWEVVKRLRPDMLTSRGGCASGAREIWVNGKRIRLPLLPTGMAAERAFVGAPARTRVTYVPISVLSDIAPEHIAEINYHDCFDTSMAAVGNNDAIFVVLKPGVVYKQDVGSFVMDQPAKKS